MAYALVGSVGTVNEGTGTCSPTFAQSTTAGNLLICWFVNLAGTPSALSGWTRTVSNSATIYYKANCGAGETAPTPTDAGSGFFVAAALAEFSGGATTTPTDKHLSASGTLTSPLTNTMASADVAGGELVVATTYFGYSMAGTKTTTHAYNNGGAALGNGNNDAASATSHYRFSYAITTGNASADAITETFTITNLTSHFGEFQSFLLAPAASTGIPSLVTRRSGP